MPFGTAALYRASVLAAMYGPALEDMAAYMLAKRLGCTLLTGDRALRRIAEHEGLDVHGTNWLLTEMRLAGVHDGTPCSATSARSVASTP